ncbi:sulfatase-like hydrolase/transferase [Haliangium sp.]|uniref:sulfatase-like hydrolase/transferase n=1 Tax=Haliangium sp. TaxID=2663208 RepID=UPI003D0BAE6F
MARKKNILMIMVDQERMPMHFPAGIELPARRWLRERGVSFERYHVNTAPCTPSRSVIFTGWHTPRNRMIDNTTFDYVGDMDPEIATLGDMAAAGGYYSVYKGKWHLARIAETMDPRYTTEDAMRGYGFRDFQHDGDLMSTAREGYSYDGRIAADTIHWLNHWLNERVDESCDTPFFLVCSLVNPHDVMTVDIDGSGEVQKQPEGALMAIKSPPEHAIYRQDHGPELCESWRRDFNSESYDNKPSAHQEFDRIFTGNFGLIPKDEAMWKAYVNYYINCQRDVDRHIMSVLQYLEDTGLVDDTIIIFTADHGEMAGAHGLRTKGPMIYKENNNVPLVICHPDGRRGESTDILASAVDLAPTLMALCGVDDSAKELFPNLFGHDVSPVVFDRGFAGPRNGILFTYTCLSTFDADFALDPSEDKEIDLSKRGFLLGICTDSHKFARYFGPTTKAIMPDTIAELRANFDLELYDLAADPDEIDNLANDSANDELMLALNRRLNALIAAELVGVSFPTAVPDDLATIRGVLT